MLTFVFSILTHTKIISLTTAHQWMHKLGWHWTTDPKGQYADGHEHEDVVDYCNNVFLPAIAEIEDCIENWLTDGSAVPSLLGILYALVP